MTGVTKNFVVKNGLTTGNIVLSAIDNSIVANSIALTGNVTVAGLTTLGNISNVKIDGGSPNYVLKTDGAGNLSWIAPSSGGNPGGSTTQVQFNDAGSFGGNSGFTYDKTTTTLTANNFVATSSANLGNVSNVKIGGGLPDYVLKTDGLGNVSWTQLSQAVAVDNFIGDGIRTTFLLSTTPSSVNQLLVNIDGVFQLRSAFTLSGSNIVFSDAPSSQSQIEVTISQGINTGSGSFVTRNYIGTGSQTNFTVSASVTASSALVAKNGILQTPAVDYTVSGTILTFTSPPENGVSIQIRELAVAVATETTQSGVTTGKSIAMAMVFGG